MSSQPLITVLMTVYNAAPFLKRSMESVLNQSFSDFEFLIVNDASTDHSLDVIWSYDDKRIVVYSNEKNMGQTKSMNRGLKLAKGKYIARMDADDLAFPRWLEELSSFLERNSSVAVVSAQAVVISGKKGIVRILNTPTIWPDMVLKSLTFSPINHVGSLMRKETVLQLGGYDEQYHVPADFQLWSRLIRKNHQLAVVPKVLIAIRFHETNQSNVRNPEEMIGIIYDNVRNLTTYPIREEEAKLLYQLTYHVDALTGPSLLAAAATLKNVYRKIRPNLAGEPFIRKNISERMKIAYMKKILIQIERSEFEEVRLLCCNFLKHEGKSLMFILIWLLSFGGTVLSQLPRIYDQVQKFRMQQTLRGESIPKGIQ